MSETLSLALSWALPFVGGLTSLAWIASALVNQRSAQRLQTLPPDALGDEDDDDAWPRLSVIVAACNEEDTVEPAVRSLLAARYPNLELLVVDDRSSDETGAILDRLALEDPRLQVVHNQHLPEGWLGKVHALHLGAQQATGDFLLFTDADVHFGRHVLIRAITLAERERLDHLSLLPEMVCPTLPLEVMVATFAGAILSFCQLLEWREGAMGVGAFNLVRRAALERSDGFPALRMEVADDAGLATVVVRAGGRSELRLAADDLRLTWYEDLPAMIRGLEKNLFGILSGFSLPRLAPLLALLLVWVFGPLLTLLPGPLPHAWVFLVAAGLGLAGYAWSVAGRLRMRRLSFVLTPLGHLLLVWTVLRGGLLCAWRGGIVWRGTRYPVAALRAGQIVRL